MCSPSPWNETGLPHGRWRLLYPAWKVPQSAPRHRPAPPDGHGARHGHRPALCARSTSGSALPPWAAPTTRWTGRVWSSRSGGRARVLLPCPGSFQGVSVSCLSLTDSEHGSLVPLPPCLSRGDRNFFLEQLFLNYFDFFDVDFKSESIVMSSLSLAVFGGDH